jgi:tRNA pseudouridine38-40 synthase
VHARRQVVTFDTPRNDIDPPRLRRSLDRLCGPEITITSVAPVPTEFDARFSAISRTYRYTILRTPLADPLRRHTVWHIAEDLDFEAMNAAAQEFLGLHDFGSFCRRHVRRSLERNVMSAAWSHRDDLLIFEIVASSYCHQMVRSVVGTMVEVGLGKRRVGEVAGIIAARDRHAAPTIAPPHGLCLWDVTY